MKYTKREMTRTSVNVDLPNGGIKNIIFTSTPDMIDDFSVMFALINLTESIRYHDHYGEISFYEDIEDTGSLYSYMTLDIGNMPFEISDEMLELIQKDSEDPEMIEKVITYIMGEYNGN